MVDIGWRKLSVDIVEIRGRGDSGKDREDIKEDDIASPFSLTNLQGKTREDVCGVSRKLEERRQDEAE